MRVGDILLSTRLDVLLLMILVLVFFFYLLWTPEGATWEVTRGHEMWCQTVEAIVSLGLSLVQGAEDKVIRAILTFATSAHAAKQHTWAPA